MMRLNSSRAWLPTTRRALHTRERENLTKLRRRERNLHRFSTHCCGYPDGVEGGGCGDLANLSQSIPTSRLNVSGTIEILQAGKSCPTCTVSFHLLFS